jgi:ubiquinone/menaquinone biosynthesis C-methylase UbiE
MSKLYDLNGGNPRLQDDNVWEYMSWRSSLLEKGLHQKYVLDAGCGVGWMSIRFVQRANHVVAIDLKPLHIKMAKTDYSNPNIEYMLMDVCNMGFPDNTFDVVILSEVLEHISPHLRLKALQECKRVTRKGGVLKGVVPFNPHKQVTGFPHIFPLPEMETIREYIERLGMHIEHFEEGACASIYFKLEK